MKVDAAVLEEYGLLLLKLKLFPYFDMAHYLLMCLAVREDIHQYQTSNHFIIQNSEIICSTIYNYFNS